MPTRVTFRQTWWLLPILAAFLFEFWTTALYPLHKNALPEAGVTLRTPSSRVVYVRPGSMADAAGMRAGDEIKSVNGRSVSSESEFDLEVLFFERGRPVEIIVFRDGITVPLRFVPAGNYWGGASASEQAAFWLWTFLAFTELGMGFFIVLTRPTDPMALLAGLFLGTLAIQMPGSHALPFSYMVGQETLFRSYPTALRWVRLILDFVSLQNLFVVFGFMALFPRPIFRERWRWAVLAAWPVVITVFLVLANLPVVFSQNPVIDTRRSTHAMFQFMELPMFVVLLLYGVAGLAAMAMNYRRCDQLQRRRMRLVFWGAAIGFGIMLPVVAIATFAPASGLAYLLRTGQADIVYAFLRLIFLLCFTYAVVRYRVLEIPLLLKRSARYLFVQRGFLLLLIVLGFGVTLALAQGFNTQYPEKAHLAVPTGALFAIALVWGGTAVHRRVSQRIDRAFFRNVYDAEHILQELAEKARTANSRAELAEMLRSQLREALHPAKVAVYLEGRQGDLLLEAGRAHPSLQSIPRDTALMQELASGGKPLEVLERLVSGETLDGLSLLEPEILVPMKGRQAPLRGLVVLGPKLSEEPYSSADLRLLRSIASQAGIAIEAITLAEDITERLAAEKMVAHELEIARSVQSKLLPQSAPRLSTLECVGTCMQARAVGGDYYDFIEYGDGKVGIVLADISGKGISAALLMSNLQATLRSQKISDASSLQSVLQAVNRNFRQSIESGNFATLFFGLYDDASRRLAYVNCGHNPPLMLRCDGSTQLLDSTATVIGAFEPWSCDVEQMELAPGDLLLAYTDGVTEATNPADEVYGDHRLLATVQQHRHLEADKLMWQVIASVTEFTTHEQQDDITVVVARARH